MSMMVLPKSSTTTGCLVSSIVISLLLQFLLAFSWLIQAHGSSDPDSWYQRYKTYPPYCSTPEEMATRKIPPLRTDDPHLGETRIVHVTAVLRHGARTPWSSSQECWNGFWTTDETAIWNCDLTTILAPPAPNRVKEEEKDYTNFGINLMFLYEKRFDALEDPEDGLTNELNGTCQVGQLLLQGYEQEIANGKMLRDAYVYDDRKPYGHDERMRLLDISMNEYVPWDVFHLRYRSDDDQRTLMSGQVVLRGLFGPEVKQTYDKTGQYPVIPVHTADRDRDILDANPSVCPLLNSVQSQIMQSNEYQQFNNSIAARGIREFMANELGMTRLNEGLLDCLMTTMCTDRPLPQVLDDYDSKDSWFRTLAEFVSLETFMTFCSFSACSHILGFFLLMASFTGY